MSEPTWKTASADLQTKISAGLRVSNRPEVISCIAATRGMPLSEGDFAALEISWISRELANQAVLRRVSSIEGAEIVGRRDNGSYGGIAFAYVWPGEDRIRELWLRRDRPEIRYDGAGNPKE